VVEALEILPFTAISKKLFRVVFLKNTINFKYLNPMQKTIKKIATVAVFALFSFVFIQSNPVSAATSISATPAAIAGSGSAEINWNSSYSGAVVCFQLLKTATAASGYNAGAGSLNCQSWGLVASGSYAKSVSYSTSGYNVYRFAIFQTYGSYATALGYTDVTVNAPVATAPSVPTGLQYSCDATGSGATVTWNTVVGATRYATRYDMNTPSWSNDCANPSAGDYCNDNHANTSHIVSVTSGQPNKFWVHACNAAGCSDFAEVDFTCSSSATSSSLLITAAPITITNSGNIVINWNSAYSTAVVCFQILKADTAANAYDPSAGSLNCQSWGRAASGSYTKDLSYSTSGYNVYRFALFQNYGSYTTALGYTDVTVSAPMQTAAPAVPTGLQYACDANGTSATVTWNAVTGATRYAARYDMNTPTWSYDCASPTAGDYCYDNHSVTSHTVSVTSGQPNKFWVHACNAAGCSDFAEVNFTCAASSASAASIISSQTSIQKDESVTITWTAPAYPDAKVGYIFTPTGGSSNMVNQWQIPAGTGVKTLSNVGTYRFILFSDNYDLANELSHVDVVVNNPTPISDDVNINNPNTDNAAVIISSQTSIQKDESVTITWTAPAHPDAKVGYIFTPIGGSSNMVNQWQIPAGTGIKTLSNAGTYRFILFSSNYDLANELSHVDVVVNNSATLGVITQTPALVVSARVNEQAKKLNDGKYAELLVEINELKNQIKEERAKTIFLTKIVKSGDKYLSTDEKKALEMFIAYGVDSETKKIGEAERTAALESYKLAFNKLPETDSELADAINIAKGDVPKTLSASSEKYANDQFTKIFKRIPDLNDVEDVAALKTIAYGLRTSSRNKVWEKAAITAYRKIYLRNPKSTSDWNKVSAIAYSGARSDKDTDKDMVSDITEKKYGLNPRRKDSDGDGVQDKNEVMKLMSSKLVSK